MSKAVCGKRGGVKSVQHHQLTSFDFQGGILAMRLFGLGVI
jgi:hypothetical protein